MVYDTPNTQQDILLALPRRRVRMPRTPRELFDLLACLTPRLGLDGLLDLIDFTGVGPSDVFLAALGRAPDSPAAAMAAAHYNPREHLKGALLSDEFRRTILSRFLTAYAEKGRDIFIHVPKCAGTDLILNLANRFMPLPKSLEVRGWITDEQFLLALGGLARIAPNHDRIFVYGHMEIGEYVYGAGTRAADRFFTVIRDPLDLMISQANYAIGRLWQDREARDPDTVLILQALDLPRLPDDISEQGLKDLAVRALRHEGITQPNRACTYLGRGMQGLYTSAMEQMVIHDVEITTTRHYERWLNERWGIGRSLRHNASDPHITREEVERSYLNEIRPLMAEDQKLFDVVSWALEQSGGASVSGRQIAGLAGAWLMSGMPGALATPLIPPAPPVPAIANLLVAQTPAEVNHYLRGGDRAARDGAELTPVLSIDFGNAGTGREYQLDGWSITEDTFTWTHASASRLQLPPFPTDGVCILRVIGNPHVWSDSLPSQRIEVLVNGIQLGAAEISDIAVLECEVPVRLISPSEPVTLTFRMPKAARPHDLSGIDDDRLLGFALHRVAVLKMAAVGR